MRKLYTILILMFLMFGVSSVFAQDNPTEEIVVVSGGGGSSRHLVSVHDTKEIASPDVVTQPTVSSSGGSGGNVVQVSPVAMTEVTSTSSGGGSGFSISSYAHGRCAIDEEKLDKLHRLVTQIRELSEIEDKEKYDELDMQIRKLSQEVKEEKQRCLKTEGTTQEVAISQPIMGGVEAGNIKIVKPTEDAIEITEYYKKKMDRIVYSEEGTDNKIYELKELRIEIDRLIESLLKNKDEIKLEEISSIVETVEIRPGEIKAGNVVVTTVNKKIGIKVNGKDLKIMPTETQVIIQDGNLKIKASELSIKKEVLKVGNSEVQLTASDVVEKIKVEPKEIELKEENAKAVYKIKVDEDRKLLGFIPVEVEKDLTVDATNQKAEIVKEEYPWWVFMTTKSK